VWVVERARVAIDWNVLGDSCSCCSIETPGMSLCALSRPTECRSRLTMVLRCYFFEPEAWVSHWRKIFSEHILARFAEKTSMRSPLSLLLLSLLLLFYLLWVNSSSRLLFFTTSLISQMPCTMWNGSRPPCHR
jgi:hypothetical protein